MAKSFGSRILNDAIPRDGNIEFWRSLFYYNVYRFSLAIFLVTAGLSPVSVGSLSSNSPTLFSAVSLIFAFLAVVYGVMIHNSWPRYIVICRITIVSDVILIIILIYASGGLGSGLELLLVVTVAASGILMGGRNALATAAFATLLLLGEHTYIILNDERRFGGFTAMGFMGLGLFITAIFIYNLSIRLRASEAELERQQLNLKNLNQLNRYIIDQLHFGVIVVDTGLLVRLINRQALDFVEKPADFDLPRHLSLVSPELVHASVSWSDNHGTSEYRIPIGSDTTLLAHFQYVDDEASRQGFIIILYDESKVEKERQNDKLIAMGHLTASIAHEIRNPLGAISHAAQLLGESSTIDAEDVRLVEIIGKQSGRVNKIIETTLELGKPASVQPQVIDLHTWLESVMTDFSQQYRAEENAVALTGENGIQACVDPDQLRQVIVNLLQNGMNHSDTDFKPYVTAAVTYDHRSGLPAIEIHDSGKGVADNLTERIFEPFFTTSSSGNGLGLYVARQICIANHGELDYIHNGDNDHYFRITLAASGKSKNQDGWE
jgi:two-component system sensor histidine kinase PilS (NtrC family)